MIAEPSEPVPAPANISPVGFSSTIISIALFKLSVSLIWYVTDLKIFAAFTFWIDLLNYLNLLN